MNNDVSGLKKVLKRILEKHPEDVFEDDYEVTKFVSTVHYLKIWSSDVSDEEFSVIHQLQLLADLMWSDVGYVNEMGERRTTLERAIRSKDYLYRYHLGSIRWLATHISQSSQEEIEIDEKKSNMEGDISGLMNMKTEKQETIRRDIANFVKSRSEAIRFRRGLIIDRSKLDKLMEDGVVADLKRANMLEAWNTTETLIDRIWPDVLPRSTVL